MLSDRPLVFVDVETTGLDPNKHEVIEIAVVFDGSVFESDALWAAHLRYIEPNLAVWHTRIRPVRIQDADPRALEVNRYQPQDWADAPTAAEVIRVVESLLTKAGANPVIAGHNVSFDRSFLDAMLQEAGSSLRVSYHVVDTVTLCYAHLVPMGLESLSLDAVRRFLGIPTEGSHAALKDALDARTVYLQAIKGRSE